MSIIIVLTAVLVSIIITGVLFYLMNKSEEAAALYKNIIFPDAEECKETKRKH